MDGAVPEPSVSPAFPSDGGPTGPCPATGMGGNAVPKLQATRKHHTTITTPARLPGDGLRRWSGRSRPLPTDIIRELRAQGVKDIQIAVLLGCHPKAIYPHLKPLTNGKRARILEAREWHAAGATFGMLAKLYGVSKGNVRYWIRGAPPTVPSRTPARRCECGGIIAPGVPHHCPHTMIRGA